jgi:hypothetical protein
MNHPISLDRNDVQAALKYAEERFKSGTFDGDDAEQLLMLQDDPDELIEKLSALFMRYEKEAAE